MSRAVELKFQGQVVASCEHSDEPSDSGAMELELKFKKRCSQKCLLCLL
jgi:hypothetical protein